MSIRLKDKTITFKPTLLGILLTLICIPLFINFGFWQYDKAQVKIKRQDSYLNADNAQAADFPTALKIIDDASKNYWQYKKIKLQGEYIPEFQFLLDNQVSDTRAGYHVITPLKLSGSSVYVLVNRGWIPANALHTDIPEVDTPEGRVALLGQGWVPSTKYFTLEDKVSGSQTKPKSVWQNMDIEQYQQTVGFAVSPLAIKLDPSSEAGGFVRNWQVSFKRIATHLGYAYQWFGFAAAALLIFIYMSTTIQKQTET